MPETKLTPEQVADAIIHNGLIDGAGMLALAEGYKAEHARAEALADRVMELEARDAAWSLQIGETEAALSDMRRQRDALIAVIRQAEIALNEAYLSAQNMTPQHMKTIETAQAACNEALASDAASAPSASPQEKA